MVKVIEIKEVQELIKRFDITDSDYRELVQSLKADMFGYSGKYKWYHDENEMRAFVEGWLLIFNVDYFEETSKGSMIGVISFKDSLSV